MFRARYLWRDPLRVFPLNELVKEPLKCFFRGASKGVPLKDFVRALVKNYEGPDVHIAWRA